MVKFFYSMNPLKKPVVFNSSQASAKQGYLMGGKVKTQCNEDSKQVHEEWMLLFNTTLMRSETLTLPDTQLAMVRAGLLI